jgi:integrase
MPKRASFKPSKIRGRVAEWVVNVPERYSRSGRRERHFFESKAIAHTFCEQVRTRILNFGSQLSILTPVQSEEALQAFQKLLPFKVTLNRVVEEWIDRRHRSNRSVSFEQMMDEFAVAGRRNRVRSRGYAQSIHQMKKRLSHLRGRLVSEITRQDVETAIKGLPPSVGNYALRIVSCAFNFAVRREQAENNPAKDVEQSETPISEIAVYSPAQVAKIMEAAEGNDPTLVPFLAISFFAGVRRSEILRMDWSHVELDERFIRLPMSITKTRQGRHVPMEANLVSWLTPHARCAGPIVSFSPNVLRRRERALRTGHTIQAIKHGARHCYGTYWLAAFGDINRLMLSLGHTDFETTREHYAKAATKKEAQVYWAISPSVPTRQNIVEVLAAA